jgi:two-component system, response regulator, stage 0 sporulation protein F
MKKILIVDDDVSLLDMLRDLLAVPGKYDVMTTDRGQRALSVAATYHPDLIILDMTMPGMGGVEFLREVSNPDGSLRYRVLVMTARANMAEFFTGVPVDGFVAKPCDLNAVRQEVDRILALQSAPHGEPRREPPAATRSRRVLLGEDDPLVGKAIADALRRAGYAVECVLLGPMLLEKAIADKPDAILTKLILTNLNGDAVARMLKEMPGTSDIPVVLYDGTRKSSDESRPPLPRGSVGKYVKSDDPQELLAAVRAVLASSKRG